MPQQLAQGVPSALRSPAAAATVACSCSAVKRGYAPRLPLPLPMPPQLAVPQLLLLPLLQLRGALLHQLAWLPAAQLPTPTAIDTVAIAQCTLHSRPLPPTSHRPTQIDSAMSNPALQITGDDE